MSDDIALPPGTRLLCLEVGYGTVEGMQVLNARKMTNANPVRIDVADAPSATVSLEDGVESTFSGKGDWPYYWVSRVSALYALELEKRLKPIGLDVSRWRVLASLLEHGGLGVSEISDYCILKLNTTTKIVQRMTAEGLVTTRGSPFDGRVTEVQLTEAGKEAALRAARIAQQLFERTFSDFEKDEIAQLNRLLKRLFAKLA